MKVLELCTFHLSVLCTKFLTTIVGDDGCFVYNVMVTDVRW
jgi:hypothetical protein